MSQPRASIVMPCYNTASFIGDAIASVRSQTMEDWELLVVDDCSTDGSLDTAEHAARGDPRIRLMRQERNGGVGPARNRAIGEARGRYVAFLDSDDEWLPGKLDLQLDFMARTGAGFSYTAYHEISEAGEQLRLLPVPAQATYRQVLRCCVIGCLTAVYDTQATGKVFMPELRKRQDWATWLDILRNAGPAQGLNVPLARYRLRAGSLSRNKSSLVRFAWTLYRDNQGLSVPHSAAMLALYGLNGVLRRHVPGFASTVKFI